MGRVAEISAAVDDAARLGIGGNNPPEPTPYETIKLHIDDLMETAQGFLDGEPISTQEQADDIGKLLDDARQARIAADAQRKIEAKPFDDGKAEVQARWTPYSDEKKGKCALIAETCKKALAPFLAAKQAKIDADAAEARRVADEKAKAAQDALQAASATDLAARDHAEQLLKEANKADRVANKATNARATATGGARAVSLRTVWSATINNRREALNHYLKVDPGAFVSLLQDLADNEARNGPRTAPGVFFQSEQVAQ